jgi:hypothetical protein
MVFTLIQEGGEKGSIIPEKLTKPVIISQKPDSVRRLLTSHDARTKHRTKHRTQNRASIVQTPYSTYIAPLSGFTETKYSASSYAFELNFVEPGLVVIRRLGTSLSLPIPAVYS